MAPVATNSSAGRFPDGADTDSNCTDFLTQAVATLSVASPAGATNLKVTSVEGFRPGQTILIDSGANLETAVISTVGTAGATTLSTSTSVGATVLHTANVTGFSKGQEISIDDGANSETAVVSVDQGPRRRHHHARRTTCSCARVWRTDFRQRYQPHHSINPDTYQWSAGLRQRSHSWRAEPIPKCKPLRGQEPGPRPGDHSPATKPVPDRNGENDSAGILLLGRKIF